MDQLEVDDGIDAGSYSKVGADAYEKEELLLLVYCLLAAAQAVAGIAVALLPPMSMLKLQDRKRL